MHASSVWSLMSSSRKDISSLVQVTVKSYTEQILFTEFSPLNLPYYMFKINELLIFTKWKHIIPIKKTIECNWWDKKDKGVDK